MPRATGNSVKISDVTETNIATADKGTLKKYLLALGGIQGELEKLAKRVKTLKEQEKNVDTLEKLCYQRLTEL